MRGRGRLLLLLLLAGAVFAPAANAASVEFTELERTRILAHGPWPRPATRDPSNRVSGKAEAIAFGERLFFDTRLSSSGLVSCAACHQPKKVWTDGRERAIGLAVVDRNTPSLADLRDARWYGWDGGNDSLWSQSLRPLLDPREMGNSMAGVAKQIRTVADFACHYRQAFGRAPPAEDEAVVVDAAKALAAFQETLDSGRTPFDDFRDALARDDAAGMARYPQAAQRGLKLFAGRGRCELCHSGPTFSNGEFNDTGIAFFKTAGGVDAGRHGGIKHLQASPYNLLGPWNDDPARSSATSTRYLALEHRNFGEFKVPGLRNVAQTAPYMHNGSKKTLAAVVDHYSELPIDRLHADGERLLAPLNLTPADKRDLIAFLESLTAADPGFRRTQTKSASCD
jgi:cytochrome c peroxidase